MKLRPILFQTPMVQAIKAGIKTQTRRLIKNQYVSKAQQLVKCPDGKFRWWIKGARYVNSMQFKQHCTGHLALAANAATITTVRAELGTAIRYLEANKMTTGNTSVLWQTPADDVGFWYRNLKSVHTQLAAVSDRAPALERSNVQLRVRQVLLHHGRHGDVVVVPDGLSRYPHNVVWAILCTLSVVLLLILIAPCLGDAADELDMVDLDYD